VPIAFTDTALDVFHKVTEAAGRVVLRAYPLLCAGQAPRVPMNLAAGSYFGRRRPADGRIPWGESAVQIHNLVRGVTHPYPGAFSYLQGRKVYLWNARPAEGRGAPGEIVSDAPLLVGTGGGLLEVCSLQFEGEAESSADAFVRQAKVRGLRFSDAPDGQEGTR
jgi:methionyl-tRNA formyltransferase